MVKGVKKHKCVGHWFCVSLNGGTYEICRKCIKGICSDSKKECPYILHGIRWKVDPDEDKPKSSLGGKRSHGN